MPRLKSYPLRVTVSGGTTKAGVTVRVKNRNTGDYKDYTTAADNKFVANLANLKSSGETGTHTAWANAHLIDVFQLGGAAYGTKTHTVNSRLGRGAVSLVTTDLASSNCGGVSI